MFQEDLKVFPWLKGIEENLIHDYSAPYNHESCLLREELSITHKTYNREINSLKDVIDDKELKINQLFDRIISLEIIKEKMDESYDELAMKCSLLIRSREDWVGRSLKFHYLFQEMDKIGLQQSDDIFLAYKDIEMPIDEIPIQIRERYIPTFLTNIVEPDSSEEEF